jgi:hypothetical protein
MRRLWAAREARSALKAARSTGRLVSLTGEARTCLALAFYRGERRIGPAPLGGFLDGRFNLT